MTDNNKLINDILTVLMKTDPHCKNCEFNHGDFCFWGAECLHEDLINFLIRNTGTHPIFKIKQ